VRETNIEWLRAINPTDLFWRKGDIQRLNILLQMLNLPSTDYRENIWRLVQQVRDRN